MICFDLHGIMFNKFDDYFLFQNFFLLVCHRGSDWPNWQLAVAQGRSFDFLQIICFDLPTRQKEGNA